MSSAKICSEPDQLEAAGNPIIPRKAPFSGPRFEAFKRQAEAAKAHGALIVSQLSHPGRQTAKNLQPDPVSASDVQLQGNVMGMEFAKPHAATQAEIDEIIEGFAHAAEYCEKSGYDGVQLHGAHGYLLAQFFSQTTNNRNDKYGGSLENRARLTLEIAQEIRKRTRPDFIIGIKLNSVEFQEKGFQTEEAKQLCQLLEQNRFDFVELSGGTYEQLAFEHKRESSRKREAFFLDFADLITPHIKHTRSYVTGGFKTAGAMVNALKSVDGVGLARPVCQEPHLPLDILQGKVLGAVKQAIDIDNFGLTNVAAGSQIKQIGREQEPVDLSDESEVEAFNKDMGKWGEKMANNQDGWNYGFIDFENTKVAPYAAPTQS